jgi:hypothetical protein
MERGWKPPAQLIYLQPVTTLGLSVAISRKQNWHDHNGQIIRRRLTKNCPGRALGGSSANAFLWHTTRDAWSERLGDAHYKRSVRHPNLWQATQDVKRIHEKMVYHRDAPRTNKHLQVNTRPGLWRFLQCNGCFAVTRVSLCTHLITLRQLDTHYPYFREPSVTCHGALLAPPHRPPRRNLASDLTCHTRILFLFEVFGTLFEGHGGRGGGGDECHKVLPCTTTLQETTRRFQLGKEQKQSTSAKNSQPLTAILIAPSYGRR